MSRGDHVHVWREFSRETFSDGEYVYHACKICLLIGIESPEEKQAEADEATP